MKTYVLKLHACFTILVRSRLLWRLASRAPTRGVWNGPACVGDPRRPQAPRAGPKGPRARLAPHTPQEKIHAALAHAQGSSRRTVTPWRARHRRAVAPSANRRSFERRRRRREFQPQSEAERSLMRPENPRAERLQRPLNVSGGFSGSFHTFFSSVGRLRLNARRRRARVRPPRRGPSHVRCVAEPSTLLPPAHA